MKSLSSFEFEVLLQGFLNWFALLRQDISYALFRIMSWNFLNFHRKQSVKKRELRLFVSRDVKRGARDPVCSARAEAL